MKNKPAAFMTQTALMLALLIGVQFATRSLGQLVTGSLVNLILLVSVFLIGVRGALLIAVLSPLLAFFAGMGPAFIQIVPFVAIGNGLLVTIASAVRGQIAQGSFKSIVTTTTGLVAASVVKFLFLWVGLVLLVLPGMSGIKEQQAAVISAAFSWPQLVTALTGSALALVVVPLLLRARRDSNRPQ